VQSMSSSWGTQTCRADRLGNMQSKRRCGAVFHGGLVRA